MRVLKTDYKTWPMNTSHILAVLRTFHLAHVQRLAQLLQQVGSGRVLLVLLAVVVLLGHARVVEPGVT